MIDTLDGIKETLSKSGIELLPKSEKTRLDEAQLRQNLVDLPKMFQLSYCLGNETRSTPVEITIYVIDGHCSVSVAVSHHLERSYERELEILKNNIQYTIQEKIQVALR